MKKHIENITEFTNRFGLRFNQEGECGFGRECVGIEYGDNWVDYNPTRHPNYDTIEELYDERLNEIAAPNAYHKHDCLAVLGRGEEAIKELSEWVDRLKELNAVVVDYSTGATGIQAMISGSKGKSIKLT